MTEYLTGSRRLPPGFDRDGHLARLDVDGFTIVEDYLSEDQLAQFREGLQPYLNTYRGRNPFEGLATERVYTLVGRGKIYEEIACDHRLLAILDRLLAPDYLLQKARQPASLRPRTRSSNPVPSSEESAANSVQTAGAACAGMTEVVIRCRADSAGAFRRRHSDKFRHPRGGQRSSRTVSRTLLRPRAAHSSGRSCVELVNLANIAAYVVARIVRVQLSTQTSGEFQWRWV
jgi:hypothetical protein